MACGKTLATVIFRCALDSSSVRLPEIQLVDAADREIMKLSRLGEFGLIERLRRRQPPGRGVRIGIGDDAAWVQNPKGSSLITSDMLIEGIHFNLKWTSCFDLGFKSLAVNLSDIAAMGGTPAYAVLSLGFPSSFDETKRIDEFYRGMGSLAASTGVSIVGGDLSRAEFLTISVTLIGHPPSLPIRREGARAGDDIYVTGTLGDAALALELLKEGGGFVKENFAAALLSRHHRPMPRTDIGIMLGKTRVASAMIDVSDGLLQDLGHICKASGIGAVVDRDDLPLSAEYRKLAGKAGDRHALCGGEDYELLFCAAAANREAIQRLSRRARLAITRIGKCVRGRRVLVRDRSGQMISFSAAGHDHFQTKRKAEKITET